jgi:hypothetical protein
MCKRVYAPFFYAIFLLQVTVLPVRASEQTPFATTESLQPPIAFGLIGPAQDLQSSAASEESQAEAPSIVGFAQSLNRIEPYFHPAKDLRVIPITIEQEAK